MRRGSFHNKKWKLSLFQQRGALEMKIKILSIQFRVFEVWRHLKKEIVLGASKLSFILLKLCTFLLFISRFYLVTVIYGLR